MTKERVRLEYNIIINTGLFKQLDYGKSLETNVARFVHLATQNSLDRLKRENEIKRSPYFIHNLSW